jgi:hypothetical protein
MDVHACPAELPEQQDSLTRFQGRFRGPEGAAALKAVLVGSVPIA